MRRIKGNLGKPHFIGSIGLGAILNLAIGFGSSGCDRDDKEELNRRQGATIGSESLEGKNFADAEFQCLTLSESPSDERELPEVESDTALVQSPAITYQTNIEPLFAKKCASCHPAVSPPDLKSYDAVKKTAQASYDTMVAGSMPPGKPLPEAEIKLFKDWMDTGMTEKAASPSPAPSTGSKTPSKPKPKPAKPPINASCAAPAGLEKEVADQPSAPAPASTSTSTSTPAPAPAPTPAPAPGPAPAPDSPQTPSPTAAVYLGGIQPLLKAKCATCHAAGATPPDLSTYQAAKVGGPASKVTIDDGSMPPPATKVTMTAAEKALFTEWASKGYPEK